MGFERLFGVDFSGAKRADRTIFIAEGVRRGEAVEVVSLQSAGERFGVKDGAAAHAALAELMRESRDALFAVDVPFSFPAALMPEGWRAFADAYPARFEDADAMRAWAREKAPSELRRATDLEAKTPFAVYNLRLYRQTDAAMRRLVAPLAGDVTFAPMEPPAADGAVIVEACPASALKERGLYRPYKGRSEEARAQRAALLDDLESRVALSAATRKEALTDIGGDALDALLCLEIAARLSPADLAPREEADRIEGRVYF